MFVITSVLLLFISSPLISCKKQEPLCVEPLDGVEAYLCESRPSREPLSLQYNKAQISKPAPSFEGLAVINGEFKEIGLNDFKHKYLVLLFYPLDFTFVCPTEIIAFSDRIQEFKNLNTEVVAISVDSQFTHLAWINTPREQGGLGNIQIPLLSDLTHQISKDYGVYLQDVGHAL
ncbi:unnamed protein product, partial [Rotaria magnacalcarata]